jgi:hypothetical protein
MARTISPAQLTIISSRFLFMAYRFGITVVHHLEYQRFANCSLHLLSNVQPEFSSQFSKNQPIDKLLAHETESATLDHAFVSIFASHELFGKRGLKSSLHQVWASTLINTGVKHAIGIDASELTILIPEVEQQFMIAAPSTRIDPPRKARPTRYICPRLKLRLRHPFLPASWIPRVPDDAETLWRLPDFNCLTSESGR